MRVVGVDPGVSGGLALLEDGKLADMIAMPVDVVEIGKHKRREINEERVRSTLQTWAPGMVVIEKVWAMKVAGRSQGASSSFSFGAGWGLVRGIVCGLGFPRMLLTPQAWQRIMLEGYPKGAEQQVADALWPGADWTAIPTKDSRAGVVDAALIAEAGRRKLLGERP